MKNLSISAIVMLFIITMCSYEGYAGQMKENLIEQYDDAKRMYERLKEFAERNAMWDHFSLLGDFIKEANVLARDNIGDFVERKKKHDETWAELQYTMPWWNKIFLDEPAFYADLNLDYPGLEKVKNAVAKSDYKTAREELHTYYVTRNKPNYYNKYLTPLSRDPLIQTDAEADQYLTHQMPIHSYQTPTYDLGREFDWHVLPIIDIEWPTKIHRHFHWQTIAGAYEKTGNEKYAGEIIQQLFDWCMDNPMEPWDSKRCRWAWSTLNATVRVYLSWINSWYGIRKSESWNPDAQYVFLNALREHGRFLMKHAATKGNWVVAESQGLVELGIMFPEFKEAESWRVEGYRRLLKEIKIQVLDDGVHLERTPGYHEMTLKCFMNPVRLGLLNEIKFEGYDLFISKFEKMHEYYLYIASPRHRTPQIGDGHQTLVDSFLKRGYQMFHRLDMLYAATDGKEGEPPVWRSYAFHHAGQYINRSAWSDPMALWGFLDWGGDGGFHCHDDMGQLSIFAYGEFLLIDSGIYAYNYPPRLYFKETTGHNTVLVNKTTQKRRNPIETKWISTNTFDVFRGLTDNSEPLLHERTVAFRQPGESGPGYWLVVDRMSGDKDKTHRMDQRWHPTERMSGIVRGDQIIYTPRSEFKDSQPSLVVANLTQPNLKTEITEGFISYEWYKKLTVDLAQFTYEAPTPQTFVTVLYPTPPGREPAHIEMRSIEATLDGVVPKDKLVTAICVEITDNRRTFEDTWIINHAGEGSVVAGGIATDGRLTMTRRERNKNLDAFFTEGSRLEVDGKSVFLSAAKVDASETAPAVKPVPREKGAIILEF